MRLINILSENDHMPVNYSPLNNIVFEEIIEIATLAHNAKSADLNPVLGRIMNYYCESLGTESFTTIDQESINDFIKTAGDAIYSGMSVAYKAGAKLINTAAPIMASGAKQLKEVGFDWISGLDTLHRRAQTAELMAVKHGVVEEPLSVIGKDLQWRNHCNGSSVIDGLKHTARNLKEAVNILVALSNMDNDENESLGDKSYNLEFIGDWVLFGNAENPLAFIKRPGRLAVPNMAPALTLSELKSIVSETSKLLTAIKLQGKDLDSISKKRIIDAKKAMRKEGVFTNKINTVYRGGRWNNIASHMATQATNSCLAAVKYCEKSILLQE